MDIYEAWNKALKHTEIIRPRVRQLFTFEDTAVPYILLSSSAVNEGDTVARIGEVIVEKPALILPPNHSHFRGFDLEGRAAAGNRDLTNFFFIRGIQLPSFNYNNKTSSLSIFEGGLDKAVRHHLEQLQQHENVLAGLLTGPEDCWQFSVLLYVCTQVARNAARDIERLIEEYRKKEK